MKLYLIRHGESQANAGHLHAGWGGFPLTSAGQAQARTLQPRLGQFLFDRVISSDLPRARQTAELALPSVSYEISECVREINVGVLSGKSADECARIYGEGYLEQKARQDYTPFGGENRNMLLSRVSRFLRQTEAFPQERVAVFTHEGVLRAALDLVLECPQKKEHIACENCMIALFEYRAGIWRMAGWGI